MRKSKIICSIPYYRKDQYERLRELSVDQENFSISYEEMISITESKRKELTRKGMKVYKIDVDLEELILWCRSRDETLNPESRTKFAMQKLKEVLSKNQKTD